MAQCNFSAGDLMMIGVLTRAADMGVFENYPNLRAYVSRGARRRAFIRAFAAQRPFMRPVAGLRCEQSQQVFASQRTPDPRPLRWTQSRVPLTAHSDEALMTTVVCQARRCSSLRALHQTSRCTHGFSRL
jgi:hypothetical protein